MQYIKESSDIDGPALKQHIKNKNKKV